VPQRSTASRKRPLGARDTFDRGFIVGPAPCDTCAQSERCAVRQLACLAFTRYVHGASARSWRRVARTPSLAEYSEVMRCRVHKR